MVEADGVHLLALGAIPSQDQSAQQWQEERSSAAQKGVEELEASRMTIPVHWKCASAAGMPGCR